ncbi:MAG: tetratricopeptide repeat protein [Acidobacteriota bacterium]
MSSGLLALALALGLLAAGAAPAAAILTPEAELRLREAGHDPAEIKSPLNTDEEMRAWARKVIPAGMPEPDRLKLLLELLHESSRFDFEYQAGYTATVPETFRNGRYNCLSFSMLFVELARSLGLPASYLSIRRDHSFRRDGDLVVLTRHITAGYGGFADRTVLEFDVGPEVDYQAAVSITDTEALALFYSNRGAELLRNDQLEAATDKLRIAVLLAPEIAQSWVNLGVVHRRLDRFVEARDAYERAAALERDNIAAYQNMVILLRRSGELEAAQELIDLLDSHGNRNPFTYLTLGDFSLEDGRLSEAGNFYKKAHRLARGEADTNAAIGLWALLVGKTARAESWLRKAKKIEPKNERVVRLSARIEAKKRRDRECQKIGSPGSAYASLNATFFCRESDSDDEES